MEFVNRTRELERIKKAINSKENSLSILYGRRRIGKTRLLQQLENDDTIFFIADQRESNAQIKSFATIISGFIKDFDRVSYPDWESLFLSLNDRINKSSTVIIDEFPYLVKNSSELPSIIQKIFDDKKGLNFNLVLSGSSQQMMHNLVINSQAPLYGRASEIIKLLPLDIYSLKKILNCSAEQAIREFSVWGGIPRYWEIRKQETNLRSAIINHILDNSGILHEEPIRLFLDDSRDTVQMSTLINYIALGMNRLTEIASRMEKPATHINRPLQKLIDLGYLKREIPFDTSPRNAKKTLYKVADPFINFYFKFVIPEKTFLELGQANRIYDEIIKPDFEQYCSVFWEELCRKTIPLLFKNKLFPPAQRWWGTTKSKKQLEIDIISRSKDGKDIIVGEAKWSGNLKLKTLVDELDEKIKLLPVINKERITRVLFLKSKPHQIPPGIQIFTPDDIVNDYSCA